MSSENVKRLKAAKWSKADREGGRMEKQRAKQQKSKGGKSACQRIISSSDED